MSARLSAAVGHFDTPSSGTHTVSGLSFEPKAIIFFLTQYKASSEVDAYNNDAKGFGLGFSTGTGAGNNAFFSGTINNTEDCLRRRTVSRSGGSQQDTLNGFEAEFTVTAIHSDGFTVTMDEANTFPYRIDYLALGGEAITGAKIVTFDDRTSNGTLNVTGVGFEPKAVIFGDAWTGNGAELQDQSTSSSIRWQLSLLTASEAASMCSTQTNLSNVGASTSCLRTDSALVYQFNTDTTLRTRATLVGMTSDGFDLSYNPAFATATRRTALCLGGTFDVDLLSIIEPGGTGVVDQSMGFNPRAAVVMSQGSAATTSVAGGSGNIDIRASWGVWAKEGGHKSQAITQRRTPTALTAARATAAGVEVLQSTGASTSSVLSRLDFDQTAGQTLKLDHSVVSGGSYEYVALVFGDHYSPSTRRYSHAVTS